MSRHRSVFDRGGAIVDGIDNLLRRCIQIRPKDSLLIVGEDGADSYYESGLCEAVGQQAEKLGAIAKIQYATPGADASSISDSLIEQISTSDAVVFFSRIGDQIRFATSSKDAKKVMSYTLTQAHLGAPFATLDHQKMTSMLHLLESRIRASTRYRIVTANGTDLHGEILCSKTRSSTKKFYLELFPVMIFEPVICHNLCGNLTISKFITSTSTRAYDQSVLQIQTPVKAKVDNCVITSFDADSETVRRLIHQIERAGALSGGDPYALHSWHTGINPGTFFNADPFNNLEYWGTVAYGSPRYTHIHGAGLDPGDVSYNLMDATIWFDDNMFWDRGRFVFLDSAQVKSVFSSDEREVMNGQYHLNIGM